MRLTISRVIRIGAFFPGTDAVAITTFCSPSTPPISSRFHSPVPKTLPGKAEMDIQT